MITEIRRARVDDKGPIAELIYSSGPEMYDYLFGPVALDRIYYEFLSGVGFTGYSNVTVAVLDGEVVGTGCFFDRKQYMSFMLGTIKVTFSYFGLSKGLAALWRSFHAARIMPAPKAKEIYLCNFGVVDRLRGRGIGSEIIQHKLVEARKLGYTRFGLDVSSGNPQAEAFYTRLGMKATAEKRFSVENSGVKPLRKMEMLL